MDRFSQLEFGEARRSGAKARGGEPIRDEQYFYKQGLRYWLAGDFEPALRNYSRALEKNSTFFEGWIGQVLVLIELGEYREAMVWSDKALELFPEHPELLAAKAVTCARDGRKEKALAYSDNSMAKDNVTSRVWLARAEVLLGRKSPIAENCVRKAISIAGNDGPVIHLQAGRVLNKAGNYYGALENLREAVKLLPKSALAWYELGYCQGKLGFSEAAAAVEQSLKLHPRWDIAETTLRRFKKKGFLRKLFGK